MKAKGKIRGWTLATAALALAGCGSLIPGGGSGAAPGNASQSARAPARPAVPVASAPQSYAPRPEDASCLSDLGQSGAQFAPLPDTYAAPGCNKLGTVQLMALAGDRAPLSIANLGPVQCQVAKAFGDWARFGVDRAARQLLGSPVAKIETMGSYNCRNVAGTQQRSAHARAEAIDVSEISVLGLILNGLLIIAATTYDNKIRAYDKRTGKLARDQP